MSYRINTIAVAESDALSAEELQKCHRLKELYGEHLVQTHILPNHADAPLFPRGVTLEFSANSPMYPEPFHVDEFMTMGTALVAIKGKLPKDEVLQLAARKYKDKLLKAITASENALSIDMCHPETNADKPGSTYEPTLGVNTDNACAGLVTGTAIVNNERVTRNFIMVSAGLPGVSRALLRKVASYQSFGAPETASALGGGTVSVFVGPRRVSTKLRIADFLQWNITQYAVHAGKRNRLAIAEEIASALGLDIDRYTDHSAGTKPGRKLALPFSDTPTYELQTSDGGSSGKAGFVYYADAVNTSHIMGGVCMQYSPLVGGAFLFGQPHSEHPMGMGWVNGCANAFPASTGRRLDATQGYQAVTQADAFRFTASNTDEAHPFCWHGSLPYNDKLHPNTFRERDYAFRACERVLGRDPSITEFDLTPVLMILDQTPVQKASLV